MEAEKSEKTQIKKIQMDELQKTKLELINMKIDALIQQRATLTIQMIGNECEVVNVNYANGILFYKEII
jgi:hypothetical protein